MVCWPAGEFVTRSSRILRVYLVQLVIILGRLAVRIIRMPGVWLLEVPVGF
jgi:hypothetical protein